MAQFGNKANITPLHKKTRRGLLTNLLMIVFTTAAGFAGGTVYQGGSLMQLIEPAFNLAVSARESVMELTKSCDIKGNVSYNTGVRIYHVPGQRNYNETVISRHRGERWFCTEEEARNSGWRKARR
ncbi:MAG: hypothetical protein JKY50_01055 [Oleispira sp.]|nr:hypothetical protein [Oleispira sp.]